MTDLLHQALRASAPSATRARADTASSTLLLGAAGPLGAAVLEELIAHRRSGRVHVATTDALRVALRGVHELRLDGSPVTWPAVPAERAVLVFDHARYSHGREDAFWLPDPQALMPVGRWLRDGGVHTLLVVMPHAPSSLPEALKQGLANLDEQALAMLGFEHLLIVRSAQRPAAVGGGGARLQRLAHWMLSQLQMMVPARERPVRPARVAALVRELLLQLPDAPAGTRVMRPETVWASAQADDVDHFVRAWLAPAATADGPPRTAVGVAATGSPT